jgi:kanamycin kinase
VALDSPHVLSDLPGELHRRFAVGEAEGAWVLNPQGTVWRVGLESGDVVFVKVLAAGQYPSLADERDRLLWAADRLPVPQVLDSGADGSFEWLALRARAGRDATQPEHLDDPATTVPILAHGLRRFHDTAVGGCRFDFRLDVALEHARRRVNGDGVPASTGDDFHEEHAHLTPRAALKLLDATRPVSEDVVLCHGDYCFPNLLIEQRRVTGYLDLGEMGLADRWWDLAVATWSCDWNVGPGWQDLFLDSYGIERDDDKIAFYRLLYDLAS